ncbi:class I SAM-dependent methyltransferase [Pedobacter gandavensis]|uniref:class I SAM-dependent methyltransferase n=1 Tax=Pedobacter gandavensis TaxID=2679963 RepID=UPI00247A7F74|nr:class I SAM-dependent methyltransferase [Pedobacter gandavensis]WGQ09790.1 class I SAM-dependent methyltransferase [Pedobacter gandavensis]
MNESKNDADKKRWDNRYEESGFAYGKEPNLFFKEWLQKLAPGSILMPADGEGRNGVYAATLNWEATACDLSETGKLKALELAKEKQVSITYIVGDLEKLEFEQESFDVIGLIYAHFSADRKSMLHKKLQGYLKPGGLIIMEAFSKAHLDFNAINPKVGGPKEVDMLFSIAEIKADFENYEPLLLEERIVALEEGKYHIGQGAVIRFVGRKPM